MMSMSILRIGIVYYFASILEFLRLGIIVSQFFWRSVIFGEKEVEELTLLLDVLIHLLKIFEGIY